MWNVGGWLIFLLQGCGVEGLSLLSVSLWQEPRSLAVFTLPFFVEGCRLCAYYLWLLCSPLWGAVLLGALVLPLCSLLLVHSMPFGGRVG